MLPRIFIAVKILHLLYNHINIHDSSYRELERTEQIDAGRDNTDSQGRYSQISPLGWALRAFNPKEHSAELRRHSRNLDNSRNKWI